MTKTTKISCEETGLYFV